MRRKCKTDALSSIVIEGLSIAREPIFVHLISSLVRFTVFTLFKTARVSKLPDYW